MENNNFVLNTNILKYYIILKKIRNATDFCTNGSHMMSDIIDWIRHMKINESVVTNLHSLSPNQDCALTMTFHMQCLQNKHMMLDIIDWIRHMKINESVVTNLHSLSPNQDCALTMAFHMPCLQNVRFVKLPLI